LNGLGRYCRERGVNSLNIYIIGELIPRNTIFIDFFFEFINLDFEVCYDYDKENYFK